MNTNTNPGQWPQKQSPLQTFRGDPVSMVAMPAELLRDDVQQVLINAVGDCLDAPGSPMKIQHGDKLLIHQVSLTCKDLQSAVGQMVVIKHRGGELITKQLLLADGGSLYVKQYNPQQVFMIALENVAALFVVDMVFNADYITSRLLPKR